MFSFFRRNKKDNHKTKVPTKLALSQETVWNAINDYGRPINGLHLAKIMGMDSASVTPRLAELRKKGRIKIAYVKHGLDGHTRNFYIVSRDGE